MSNFGCCREISQYEKLELLGDGAYGKVYKVAHAGDHRIYAMKKTKINIQDDGVPPTTLREISVLRALCHPHIIQLHNVIMTEKRLYLLFEYMDSDIKCFFSNVMIPPPTKLVQTVISQVLKGLQYCHANRVLHRDLKPQNILIDSKLTVKLADFGLARLYQFSKQPYTQSTQTLWYRAPEVLMGSENYNSAADIWSIGCVLAEVLVGRPLFPSRSTVDQLHVIFRVLGTPDECSWPGIALLPGYSAEFPVWSRIPLPDLFPDESALCIDLLGKLLEVNPSKRPSAKEALSHAFFAN